MVSHLPISVESQVVRSFISASIELQAGSDSRGMRVKVVTLVYLRHSTEIQAEGGTADKGLPNMIPQKIGKSMLVHKCAAF